MYEIESPKFMVAEETQADETTIQWRDELSNIPNTDQLLSDSPKSPASGEINNTFMDGCKPASALGVRMCFSSGGANSSAFRKITDI